MENLKSVHALIQIISMWNFSLILYTSYVIEYCGKSLLEIVALSLMPCLWVDKNVQESVPPACYTQVSKFLAMSTCICIVFLSTIVKEDGMRSAITITILKHWKIINRHARQKCAGKFLFSCIFTSLPTFTFSLSLNHLIYFSLCIYFPKWKPRENQAK